MALEQVLANPILRNAYDQVRGFEGLKLRQEELFVKLNKLLETDFWHSVDIARRNIIWCKDPKLEREISILLRQISDLDLKIQLSDIDCSCLGAIDEKEPILQLMRFLHLATLAELHDQVNDIDYKHKSPTEIEDEDKIFLLTMRVRHILCKLLPDAVKKEHAMQLALIFGLPGLVTSEDLDAQFERLMGENVPLDHDRMLRVANLQRIEELHRYVDYSKWEAPTNRKS